MSETSGTSTEIDLFAVAHDLLQRAVDERHKGNQDAANKLLLAAGNVMGEKISPSDGARAQPNGTQQVTDLLRKGWYEVSQIKEATGIDANRIHVILGRLRGKGQGLESQTVKRYRLVGVK